VSQRTASDFIGTCLLVGAFSASPSSLQSSQPPSAVTIRTTVMAMGSRDAQIDSSMEDLAASVARRSSQRFGNSTTAPSPSNKVSRTRLCCRKYDRGGPGPNGVDPVSEPEINQQTIDLTAAFVRFLAPPTPLKLAAEAKRGREMFARIGCDRCHVPTLRTRPGITVPFWTPMHPAWLRCSSFAYARYARSSRLATRAPRRP
jgi:hypothetical protein